MKKCNVCLEEKELSAFQKIRPKKDGSFTYSSRCMKCNNRLSDEKRKQDKDKLEEHKRKRKEWEEKNREKLNEYQREYAKLHPEKGKTSGKKWRDANPDKIKEIAKSPKSKAAQKKWKAKSIDKTSAYWKEKNRERIASDPQYAKVRRDYCRLRTTRRRGAEGSHTLAEWEALLLETGNKCLRCGATEGLTRDHIIPITKGGTDNISNIQPLCHSCNSQKSTKTIYYR